MQPCRRLPAMRPRNTDLQAAQRSFKRSNSAAKHAAIDKLTTMEIYKTASV